MGMQETLKISGFMSKILWAIQLTLSLGIKHGNRVNTWIKIISQVMYMFEIHRHIEYVP